MPYTCAVACTVWDRHKPRLSLHLRVHATVWDRHKPRLRRTRSGTTRSGTGTSHDSGASRTWLAPRLLLHLQGLAHAALAEFRDADRVQGQIRRHYASLGAEDAVLYHKEACGHFFSDRFKLLAYRRLQEHVGTTRTGRPFRLGTLVEAVLDDLERRREDLWWSFPNHVPGRRLPTVALSIDNRIRVHAHRATVHEILETVLVLLLEQVPADGRLPYSQQSVAAERSCCA